MPHLSTAACQDVPSLGRWDSIVYGSCGVKSLAVRCYSIAVNKMFTFHLKETTVLRWDGGVKNGQVR